ncbi:gag protease polyprotein [Cucumis melo var. makuwa]|uniref:Gag protease polyprotein n=1 Tax=Cucumis melo var. makuwa TaxID=1194695 RepID=A0A5A7VHQ9_CUCMM|nr:gag protease polyprotein [Cucumis melo var. makuwa]TYK15121.1 gag protease polyprotein [Cucumis melo var. makuwa]
MPPRRDARRSGRGGRGDGPDPDRPVESQPMPDQLSTEAKHLRDFRKYNRKTFDGSMDNPTKRYHLVGDCERMLSGDVSKINWEQFKESFHAKFFSANLRYAKQKGFLNLKQSDMTVEQYDVEFDILSRFAPDVVKDEATKTKKFVRVDMSLHEKANLSKTVGRGSTPTVGDLMGVVAWQEMECVSSASNQGIQPNFVLKTAGDHFEADSHFPIGKSFCRYSSKGMDWLCANHASIDCSRKEVVFNHLSAASFKFKGARTMVLPKVISAMKASKLLSQGTWSILASVMDTREPEVSLSSKSVVKEYSDVFPDELLGLSPHKEIDFAIELEPGTISRAPYRMALAELKKSNVQL